jgi:hypothetical protein
VCFVRAFDTCHSQQRDMSVMFVTTMEGKRVP